VGRKAIDLTGMTFGDLTVIRQVEFNSKNAKWECVCSCGKTIVTLGQRLRIGRSRSCGCKRYVHIAEKLVTHGQRYTRLYGIWNGMKNRCNNPKTENYKNYGGKGVRVCQEWSEDFTIFRDWALGHGYNEDKSIDRINSNGHYEPSNCRWITMKQQQNNKSSNRYVVVKGERMTISECADKYGFTYNTMVKRVKAGLTGDELIKPYRSR
jgi:hypothetical protein